MLILSVLDVASEDQHILVADDSMVARNQIKKVLEHLGVQYTLVNDGKQAYDLLFTMAGRRQESEKMAGHGYL